MEGRLGEEKNSQYSSRSSAVWCSSEERDLPSCLSVKYIPDKSSSNNNAKNESASLQLQKERVLRSPSFNTVVIADCNALPLNKQSSTVRLLSSKFRSSIDETPRFK